MPRLTRCCARAALLYLLLGFALGGVLLAVKGGAVDPRAWLWLPAHVDALIAGWMLQLAMAMTFWILPGRHSHGQVHQALAWSAAVLLNAGLLIAVVPSLLRFWLPGPGWLEQAFPLGLTLQLAALLLFATVAWRRVAPPGRRPGSKPIIDPTLVKQKIP